MTGDVASESPEQRALIDACIEARVPFFWQSPGTLLIRRRAERVVQQVLESGFRVLGFERFELHGSEVRPRLDLIADLSDSSATDALMALSSWPEDIWIDVTTEAAGNGPAAGAE